MWRALRRQCGPFDDPGALKHLRTTSAETLEKRHVRWLRWLHLHEPAALQEAPTARTMMPRLQVWLDGLAHTAPMSRLMFFDGLLRVMTAAAPEADWTAHRRVTSRLKRAAGRGDPARKAGRVLSTRVQLEVGEAHAGAEADAASSRCSAPSADGTAPSWHPLPWLRYPSPPLPLDPRRLASGPARRHHSDPLRRSDQEPSAMGGGGVRTSGRTTKPPHRRNTPVPHVTGRTAPCFGPGGR